jgi:hypothetical protein
VAQAADPWGVTMPGNISELLERRRFPMIIVDTRAIDASSLRLRPGGVWRVTPEAIRMVAPEGVPPWEDVRLLLEESEVS